MAILSARRATESRCVINSTVFTLGEFSSAPGPLAMVSIVSKIFFCACASREDVYAPAVIISQSFEGNERIDAQVHQKEGNGPPADGLA